MYLQIYLNRFFTLCYICEENKGQHQRYLKILIVIIIILEGKAIRTRFQDV